MLYFADHANRMWSFFGNRYQHVQIGQTERLFFPFIVLLPFKVAQPQEPTPSKTLSRLKIHPGAFFHRLLNKLHFAKAHAKCNSSSQKGNLREWTQVWPISEISQANEPVLGPIPVYFGEAPKARSGTICHDLS